jgi:NAD+ diphosphatase
MKLAETVTFGGSGLNRAAELRADAARLHDAPESRTILLWRGKLLMQGDESARSLVRLPMDHAMLADAAEAPALLGVEEAGGAVFAQDISRWDPEGQEDVVAGFLDPTEQRHPQAPGGAGFVELRGAMTLLTPRDAELAATARGLMEWHRTHGFCARCGAPSRIAMAGWQRRCPACGGGHFPRTDPVVIMLITHGSDVLLGRSPGWPEGMYSLLAGFVEPGETIEAAVRREVFEESGIRVGQVGYLASQPWPFPASLMLGCHGAAETSQVTIDPDEIEDARWFSRDDILASMAGRHPLLKPARRGAIAHFLLHNWLADRLD